MRKIRKLVILLIVMISAYTSFAQETVKVPITCIKSFWIDSPTNDSSYEWTIENGGGKIVSGQNTDKIFVEFDSTEGTSTICVYEINVAGCEGEKSSINILRFIGPNATIAINGNATLCYDNVGSEVVINFTGAPPFLLKYTINSVIKSQTINDMKYIIPASRLTETMVYELVSVTDINKIESPLTGYVTIEVMPELNPLIIKHD